MAGEDLKGWKVYINTYTVEGRRNVSPTVAAVINILCTCAVQVVLGTWGVIFGLYFLRKIWKGSKAKKAIANTPQ